MTLDQMIAFGVLLGALALFVWGKWRYDLVALAALIVVTLAGLIDPAQALTGFGNPAVITVAAVLVISRALNNSGIVDVIARRISPYTEKFGDSYHPVVRCVRDRQRLHEQCGCDRGDAASGFGDLR